MFIRELQVDGYGALQGVELTLDASVTVLYGPNEAGKSTLLRFIRSMLYGFPTRKEMVERGEPVRGGRHGGRLLLHGQDGREWLVERYAERGSGLTVRDAGGLERQLSQAEWERLALGGINEKLFRQLFSVSLDELHQLRSLQGEEIGNYLYHAGLAGGAALTGARRRIAAEMDKLYRPKGVTQEMNKLMAAIKEAEAAIRQSRDHLQQFYDRTAELQETVGRIAESERVLPRLRELAAEAQSAFELREWWIKSQSLRLSDEEVRGSLPDPTAPLLPEAAQLRWTELKARRGEIAGKLEQAHAAQEELARAREAHVWSESLMAALPELERLESLREGIAARREEEAELEAERRMLDEMLSASLSRLSADWGEAELRAFGGALSEREQLRRLMRDWEESERALQPIQGELKRIARMQDALQAEADEASDDKIDGNGVGEPAYSGSPNGNGHPYTFLPSNRTHLLQAWHALEDAMRAYERVLPIDAAADSEPAIGTDAAYGRGGRSRRSPNQQPSAIPAWLPGGAAVVFAVAGIALPFALSDGGAVSPLVATGTAVLLLASGVLATLAYRAYKEATARSVATELPYANALSESTQARIRAQRQQVVERLSRLIVNPESMAESLTNPSTKADDTWRRLRESVHARLDELERRDRAAAGREQRQQRMKELRTESEAIERDAVKAKDRIEELKSLWQQWLQRHGLPAGLTPDSVPELFNQADQALATLRQLQRVSDRLHTIRQTVDEFAQAANAVIETSSLPAALASDSVLGIRWLYVEALKHRQSRHEAETIDREREASRAHADKLSEQAREAAEELAAFLAEYRVADEAELELRLRVDERSRELRRELRDAQLRLESGRSEAAREKLYARLNEHDEAALAVALAEQNAALAAEERQRTEWLDRRGRLMQELERLRTDAELEDRRQTLIERESQLESLLERYAVLALSDRLMSRAKAVFEEERQPEVLRRSSGYFRQMTGGAYDRIVAPGDRSALLAVTPNRHLLDSAFLSRGTQEQLYLSMRFALCDAASSEHPLPLLLDDLFVHFDEKRLRNTLPVIGEMATRRQMILFTCHRHVAEMLESGITGAKQLVLR
ncbi:AAA family ATPase [Cohnella yongneupensis]|uniref:AAA family ATPase n=1 Tax=Cohnella yongneupensis TaxID=425006 RepID=A0ABW0R1U7_9BACL